MGSKRLHRAPEELPERVPPLAEPSLSRAAFYDRYPPAVFMRAVHEKRGWRTAPWLAVTGGAGLAGAVALLLIFLAPPPDGGDRGIAPPERHSVRQELPFGMLGDHRDKGLATTSPGQGEDHDSSLVFELLRAGRFAPLRGGEILHAGDLLRFSYSSTRDDFLFLFGVDDHGTVSSWYPDRKGASIPIERGREITLPDGVLLDEYVGHERFFALFTSQPLSHRAVEVAVQASLMRLWAAGKGVRELETLPLPGHLVSVHFEKR